MDNRKFMFEWRPGWPPYNDVNSKHDLLPTSEETKMVSKDSTNEKTKSSNFIENDTKSQISTGKGIEKSRSALGDVKSEFASRVKAKFTQKIFIPPRLPKKPLRSPKDFNQASVKKLMDSNVSLTSAKITTRKSESMLFSSEKDECIPKLEDHPPLQRKASTLNRSVSMMTVNIGNVHRERYMGLKSQLNQGLLRNQLFRNQNQSRSSEITFQGSTTSLAINPQKPKRNIPVKADSYIELNKKKSPIPIPRSRFPTSNQK